MAQSTGTEPLLARPFKTVELPALPVPYTNGAGMNAAAVKAAVTVRFAAACPATTADAVKETVTTVMVVGLCSCVIALEKFALTGSEDCTACVNCTVAVNDATTGRLDCAGALRVAVEVNAAVKVD